MLMKFIVSLLPVFIYIYLKTKKSLQMLQQNWYNDGNRYLKWINKNLKKVFYNLDIFILLLLVFLIIKIDIIWIMVKRIN